MSHRRKRRWFRRLAVGLAFASFAAPAAAKYDEGSVPGQRIVTAGGWSGAVDPETGIPLSAGIGAELASPMLLGEDVKSKAVAGTQAADPYLSDVFVRQGESLGGPDGLTAQPAAGSRAFVQGVTDFPQAVVQFRAATRPDDAADRFAHSDVASSGSQLASGSTAEWNEGLGLAIGAIVLGLALGLGLGYLSRPRLAGSS
jgi:hypothetical protein